MSALVKADIRCIIYIKSLRIIVLCNSHQPFHYKCISWLANEVCYIQGNYFEHNSARLRHCFHVHTLLCNYFSIIIIIIIRWAWGSVVVKALRY